MHTSRRLLLTVATYYWAVIIHSDPPKPKVGGGTCINWRAIMPGPPQPLSLSGVGPPRQSPALTTSAAGYTRWRASCRLVACQQRQPSLVGVSSTQTARCVEPTRAVWVCKGRQHRVACRGSPPALCDHSSSTVQDRRARLTEERVFIYLIQQSIQYHSIVRTHSVAEQPCERRCQLATIPLLHPTRRQLGRFRPRICQHTTIVVSDDARQPRPGGRLWLDRVRAP